MSKVRVESMWYHESPHISIVSIDAISYSDDKYVKVALFCLQESIDPASVAAAAPPPARRSSFSLSMSTPAPAPPPVSPPSGAQGPSPMRRSSRGDYQVCTNKFSIDIGTSDTERMQLEVCLLTGAIYVIGC